MSHSPQETGQNTGETERESREQAASPGLRAPLLWLTARQALDLTLGPSVCLSACPLPGSKGFFITRSQ